MTAHDDIARLEAHAKKIGAPTLSSALAEFQRIRDIPPMQRTTKDRARLREADRIARKIEGHLFSDSQRKPRHSPSDRGNFWIEVAAFALCFILAMSFWALARWWFE